MTPKAAPEAPDGDDHIDVLVFRASGTTFGVCIDQILEIEEVEEFARLPSPDPTVRGALLARGRPLPMVDVCRRLDLASPPRYTAPVLLVTLVGPHEVGFLLDDPEDVVSLAPRSFRGLPEVVARTLTAPALFALAVWGDRLVVLLDLPSLMKPDEAGRASELAREAFPPTLPP